MSAARRRASTKTARAAEPPAAVLIVGAGFAGLGAAIRLQQAGIRDIVIVERASEIGGTWRDNQYPGAACDIPSHLYSYSFAPNPDWSRGFSGSAEILAYVRHLADAHALHPRIRLGHRVTALEFDEARGLWRADIEGRDPLWARSVVMAQGPLSNASFPSIAGIDRFEGKKIHSARWDHGYDFSGKRVAVIGTGASAVQIVPAIVDRVARLKVFQRTPNWILPRPDFATPGWSRRLFRQRPVSQRAVREALFWAHESMALGVVWTTPLTSAIERLGRAFLRLQVKDRWLRRQLTPDYRIGCKRVLITNDYLPALQKPQSELISWPIVSIVPKGIRTAEGLEHEVDCIVFATGFEIAKSGAPFPVIGRGGRRLDDDWARGSQAYKSVSVSGYPNLFLTFGPNSGPGHNSALVYMEAQIDYIVDGIRLLLQDDLRLLDVLEPVQERYNYELQRRLGHTNWNSGCKSWYLTADGYNATMYPGLATQFRQQMKHFDGADYEAVAF